MIEGSEVKSLSKADALVRIRSPDTSFFELGILLEHIEGQLLDAELSIGVSSSVTIDLLETFIRRHAVIYGEKLEIVTGNYDDPIGDMKLFSEKGIKHILLVPFFDTLFPCAEARSRYNDAEWSEEKASEICSRYEIALSLAPRDAQISVCTFHSLFQPIDDGLRAAVLLLNEGLKQLVQEAPNARLIDTDELISEVGRREAFDLRFYFRARAPYTVKYLDALARRYVTSTRCFGKRYFKVLAVDCDNTLWGGVLGEDLLDGVALDPHTYPGSVFWQVQHELVALQRRGALLVLVSKNNEQDVIEAVTKHKDMVITINDIATFKVNWTDKVTNLEDLAAELNLGLDSFVFLDDSEFECDAVRNRLPEVQTFQVPKSLPEYLRVIAEIRELFFYNDISEEAHEKTRQYKAREAAERSKTLFGSHEDYLHSLEITVDIFRNSSIYCKRMAELSQKTNQFNLTGRRYTESEMAGMIGAEDYFVYAMNVRDKFGPSGVTGLLVVSLHNNLARVENLCMSCRVLGRGIERSFWPLVVADLITAGCSNMEAEFIPSAKNGQVSNFFNDLGFVVIEQSDKATCYRASFDELNLENIDWIRTQYV